MKNFLSNAANFFLNKASLTTSFCLAALMFFVSGCSKVQGGVLNPAGLVAQQERTLMFDSLALMMIVVIPVIIMSLAFAIRYRSSHKTSDYKPNWSHNTYLEAIWWGIPLVIVVVLGVITWKKTHQLDPYRPLAVPGKVLNIEAVAMQWKWLFIYPEQGIATVNYLRIPKDRQVQFLITADAPMSSFFIPQLGSQIFAMAGMRTRLHLIGSKLGTYQGMNTQYNGDGFSDMKFNAEVVTPKSFANWVSTVKLKQHSLSLAEYKRLAKPTIDAPVEIFSSAHKNLFKLIMMQYMRPNMNLH